MDQGKKELTPLYDKKVKCIFCGQTFNTKKVRSNFTKTYKTDTDFRPCYKEDGERALHYYVNICPLCGFAFSDDFSDYISTAAREKVEIEMASKWDKTFYCSNRDMDKAVRTYKLAIYAAQMVGQRHIVFANLCLRLAWIYREAKDFDSEKRFLSLAAKEYEESFINTDFNNTAMREIEILYLIGELNRRLGNYEKSLQYFKSVVGHEDRSRYTKLVNMARDQWKVAIEEYRMMQEEEQIQD